MKKISKKKEKLIEEIAGFDIVENEFLTMDGFNNCIIGVVERFGIPPIVCYDKKKVLKKLMKEGMTYEEAIEYHEFNQIGAWVGDGTPCFLTKD